MVYIALLRGVNVGGNNIIPMARLKEAYEAAGFQRVMTYINSGNVLFEAPEENVRILMEACRGIILDAFGLDISVNVIPARALGEAIATAPAWWNQDKGSKHNALFVIPPATAEEMQAAVGPSRPEYEQVESRGQVIFWSAPSATFSRTWSKVVGSKAYASLTIRNANTTLKLWALVQTNFPDAI